MNISKAFILFTCAQLGVAAQETVTNRVPAAERILLTPSMINDYAEEARTNNAALWAARSRLKAAEQNARSIPLWRDPEVMVGGMAAETMMRMEDGDLMYGVEQMLPVFGKERAARKAARAEIPVEEADLEFQFQTIRKTLAQALIKAVLADEVLVLSQQDLLWLETITKAVEQRYEVGDASQMDVLRVQNERSRRAEQIRNEENDRESAYAVVNRLLNRNVISGWPRMELPEVAPVVPFSSTLVDFAAKFEPQLQMMRKKKEQAEAMANLTRKERRPDLSASVEARQYARTGDSRSTSFVLKMSLPWLNQDKYNAAIRRDEERVKQVDYEIEDYLYEVRTEVHHLVAMIDNARREALLYRDEIIPRSELALRSAEAAWQSSRDAFRDVLDGRRMLLEARTMYFKAVAEQYLALSELIACCGVGDFEALQMLVKQSEGVEKE
jgi:cobalt-zinc-cadmium efflux system outer membrane protein